MTTAGDAPPAARPQPPRFGLRPGSAEDYAFARRLYMDSMEPLLTALGAWDAREVETLFRGYFIPEEVQCVTLNGEDIGWLQVSTSEGDGDLHLDQVHLVEDVQGLGIGTILIKSVIDRATAQGKNVRLSFVKGNRALSLYQRLGFHQCDEDATKIHMRFLTG